MPRSPFLRAIPLLLAWLMFSGGTAAARDKVTIGTNWLAQAEHGGFYQALADGTYARMGLDVTIVMGGPDTPNRARLIAGQIQFVMGATLAAFDAVASNVPIVTVAAIFQKDPQAMLVHPESPVHDPAGLAGLRTLYIAGGGYDTFYRWLKARYPGFSDDRVKPYTFNSGPFIVDPQSAQQAYITAEPYSIKQQAGWTPRALLLADYGYGGYADTIETQKALVDRNPDLVQRFVNATIIGWYHYLYGDNKAANRLIEHDNPDMTEGQIAYTIAQIKRYGLVVSGAAITGGIGCMTDARYTDFYRSMVQAKILPSGLDIGHAYTTRFVCHGVGRELAPH